MIISDSLVISAILLIIMRSMLYVRPYFNNNLKPICIKFTATGFDILSLKQKA